MADRLKKALYVLWVLWIVVFCLATFTKIDMLEQAKTWFLLIVGAVHFLYLSLAKDSKWKWLFIACSIIFFALFAICLYGMLFKW